MPSGVQPQPFGRYVLLERIAVGGMAEIFKAQFRSEGDFEKTLVIKRILPHLAQNDEFISMFRDEAKLTVRLAHANIVQVFDFGREDQDYYLAMEFVHGQNLRSVITRSMNKGQPALPIPVACYIACEIAKGLAYAHTRKDADQVELGIIHRDITPSNVLISYEGEVKIADFGIAKAASRSNSTQQGMIKGKAAYLAPEQLTQRNIDARVDVFALGSCFWEMLTGRRLLIGDTDLELLGMLASDTPFPKPSEFRRTVTPDVDRIAMKAIERKPDERYANAAAFQRDLQTLVTRMAITSTEVTTWLTRMFQKELEAERTSGKGISVVNNELIAAAVKQEATRTQQSSLSGPPIADKPESTTPGMAPGTENDQKATKYLHTPLPQIAPLLPQLEGPSAPRPRPEPGSRTALLGGIGVLALIAAGAGSTYKAGYFTPPASPTPNATPTQVAVASIAPTSTPAVSSPTPQGTASIADPSPTAHAAHTPRPHSTPTVVAVIAATPVPGPPAIVSIDSNPSGEIFLDGKATGRETPSFDLEVPPGHHDIKVVNPVSKLEAHYAIDAKSGEKIKAGTLKLAAKPH